MPSPRRIDRDRHIGAPPQDALLQPEALLRDLSRAEGWEGFPCQDRLEGFDARALNRSGKPCQFFPFGIKRSDDSNGCHERVNQSFEAVSMDLS